MNATLNNPMIVTVNGREFRILPGIFFGDGFRRPKADRALEAAEQFAAVLHAEYPVGVVVEYAIPVITLWLAGLSLARESLSDSGSCGVSAG